MAHHLPAANDGALAFGVVIVVLVYLQFRVTRWIIRLLAGPGLSKRRASFLALVVMALLGGMWGGGS